MGNRIVVDSIQTGTNDSSKGCHIQPVEDLPLQSLLISCTTPVDEVAECLIQHKCKDITSELDFEKCDRFSFVRGGFGSIHQGYLRNGKTVAIKCVEVSGDLGDWELKEKSIKHAAHELYASSKCDHPSILQTLGFARFGGHILLISPWMKNGSLAHDINRHPKSIRLQLSVELASALVYLHDVGIVHGDIKAASISLISALRFDKILKSQNQDNVVMSDEGHVQLGDFGSAILLSYSSVHFTQTESKGTWGFMAPELMDDTTDKHTVQSDVYALGMTILQIMTGVQPFVGIPNPRIYHKVVMRKLIPDRPDFNETLVDQATRDGVWSLLTRCWAYGPEDRPRAIEVKETLIKLGKSELTHRVDKLFPLSQFEQDCPSNLGGRPHHRAYTSVQVDPRTEGATPTGITARNNSLTSSTRVPALSDSPSEHKSNALEHRKKTKSDLAALTGKVQPSSIVNSRTATLPTSKSETFYNAYSSYYQDPDLKSSSYLTRPYKATGNSQYRAQLYIWCDRLRFGHIQFITELSDQRDTEGRQIYRACPIFPAIIDLGARYLASGRTEQEAYRASLSMIPWAQFPSLKPQSIHCDFSQSPHGSVTAKPCLVTYGQHVHLTHAVGFGTSRSKAEDAAAEILLQDYCFFN